MGLDALAYKAATLLDPHEQTEDCWENHVLALIVDPSFHRSLRGLVADRCYEVEGVEAAHVGNSYSGHSRFRDELSRVFLGVESRTVWGSPDRYADRPFFELIHFADNEGTIGPDAAADLAADFAEGRTLWQSRVSDEWLLHKYDEWAEVFATAADGGLVRFA